MKNDFSNNSLLGELKKNGIDIKNDKNGECFPLDFSCDNFEDSPFNLSEKIDDPIKKDVKIVKKRLNELDNNFFQESNYIDIKDDELTKSEKISKIKKLIKNIDEKLFMLEDSDDKILIEKLNSEKEILKSALNLLLHEVQNKKNIFNTRNRAFIEFVNKVKLKEKVEKIEKIFFKFFPYFERSFLVRRALAKLVKLNENINSLCLNKIPYGESEGRYNDIIAYLSCANVIHAKLTKKI